MRVEIRKFAQNIAKIADTARGETPRFDNAADRTRNSLIIFNNQNSVIFLSIS